jgi:hypothetical protein
MNFLFTDLEREIYAETSSDSAVAQEAIDRFFGATRADENVTREVAREADY